MAASRMLAKFMWAKRTRGCQRRQSCLSKKLDFSVNPAGRCASNLQLNRPTVENKGSVVDLLNSGNQVNSSSRNSNASVGSWSQWSNVRRLDRLLASSD